MRRKIIDADLEPVLGSGVEALREAVPAVTPAARTTSLPSPTVSAAEAPPAPAAGTATPLVSRRRWPGLGRWFAAHTQAAVIVGLVVVTTFATGLVIAGANRQLDVGPGQRTTPYLAARPSGPIEAPVRGVGTAGGSPSHTATPGSRKPRPAAPPAKPGMPPNLGLPELGTSPHPPETSRPPETSQPPETGKPRLTPPPTPTLPDRRCDVRAAGFGRCVLRLPSPPRPPHVRHRGGHSRGGWSSSAVPRRNS